MTKHETAPMPMGNGANNKILLVDDDGDIRDHISTVLDFEGFHVITATNGQDALDLLHKEDPSLILLDIVMPIMDGYQFFKELQRQNDLKGIPVIIISAKEIGPIKGVRAILRKPLNTEQLVKLAMQYCIPEITKARKA